MSLPVKHHFFEIDVLRSISILTVVLIHSIDAEMGAATHNVEKFLGDWTRFAVPGLLFASGFLFKKGSIACGPLAVNLLRRIIPPYLFCSLIILIFDLPGQPPGSVSADLSEIVFNLVFGNVIGIYYFVFVILYLFGFSLLIRRLPVFFIWSIWGSTVVLTILFYIYLPFFIPVGPKHFFFFLMRHPCVHLLPYLTGWLFSVYYQHIRAFLKHNFNLLLPVLIIFDTILIIIVQFVDTFTIRQLIIQVHIYLFIFFLFLFGIERSRLKAVVSFLSQNTYGIFLIHFPIVRSIQELFLEAPAEFSFQALFVSWVAGLLGSLIVIEVFKRVLGKLSFYLVGA